MKRASNLFNLIIDRENLRLAYLKALRGKCFTPAAIIFGLHTDENLDRIRLALQEENYQFGNYRQFKIYDPKKTLDYCCNL